MKRVVLRVLYENQQDIVGLHLATYEIGYETLFN